MVTEMSGIQFNKYPSTIYVFVLVLIDAVHLVTHYVMTVNKMRG